MIILTAAAAVTQEMPSLEDIPLDIAATAVFTGLLTHGVRMLVLRNDPAALDGKPYVLFWVSAASAILGGATAAVLQGEGVVSAVVTAATGWASMQAARRLKKGANVA